ncbi:MAG: hypothetical protein ACRC8Y_23495 [Chroococcales cyanobacterium]
MAFATVPLVRSGLTGLFAWGEGLTDEDLSLGLGLDELGVGSGFMVFEKAEEASAVQDRNSPEGLCRKL